MNVRRIAAPALVLAALVPSFSLAQESFAPKKHRPGVVYGDDDRRDLYDVKDTRMKQLAASTVALFKTDGVTVSPDGATAALASQPFGESWGLCPDEPFRDQGTGAFCSGSLVASDVIMTAGHCVPSEDECKGIKFVFGFGISEKGGKTPGSVSAGEVYGCAHLIGRQQEGQGADWALVKLDRPVVGHNPLKLNRAGPPAVGTPVVVIGHPSGLPTKVAGGAKVRSNDKPGFFVANTDTYGGNSGSAVFNGNTGLVEGVLVRGEQDFVYDDARQCRKTNYCPADGCRGEDITTAAVPAAQIPLEGPAAALKEPGPTLRSLHVLAGESTR